MQIRDHSDGHTHDHGHGHGHSHETTEENNAARRHPEHVVLDIGEDIGALIVHTDASMVGFEVEISPTGQDGRRSHKDVLEREINGRPAYTAVFDKVREGTYTLWVDDVARARNVVVTGGAVGELDWVSAERQNPVAAAAFGARAPEPAPSRAVAAALSAVGEPETPAD